MRCLGVLELFDRIADSVGRGREARELVEQTQLGIAQEVIRERFGIETKFEDRGTEKRQSLFLVHAETGQLPKDFLTVEQRTEMRREVRRRTAKMAKGGKGLMVQGVAR